MKPSRLIPIAAFAAVFALAAVPAHAADQGRQRAHDRGHAEQHAQAPARGAITGRAVPRTTPPPRRSDARRDNAPAYNRGNSNRGYANRGYDNRRDGNRAYTNRGDNHGAYANRGYGNRRYNRTVIVPRIVPRIVRPRILNVVPYRPYIYRPTFRARVYYGPAYGYGYDPYAYAAPDGYFNPIPGHFYGGVRIKDAPRDAQVFADGYYVGIVDDFDGIFQHMNLEAGPHHIEIQAAGYAPIAFDVDVPAGETITYHAEMAAMQPYQQ
ncbi:MAG TPA: hypothetical protein VFX12_02015 [Vicinamibacterales bacterium]|nr:hypothetical protein [Vicinamibacterales bacterium]